MTDQGIIEGAAHTAVLYQRELGAKVAIFADVFVKHAAQLGDGTVTLEDAAKDAVARGLTDALIVSGSATVAPRGIDILRCAALAAIGTPLLVGSGFGSYPASALLQAVARGAIVGTSLKVAGRINAPADAARVRAL